MTEVKENFKGKYFTHECELHNDEEENIYLQGKKYKKLKKCDQNIKKILERNPNVGLKLPKFCILKKI